MPACPNCQANVSADWAHCNKCGADLKSGRFSSTDDPIEDLKGKFDRINEYLTEKFPEDLEEDPNEPPNTPTPPQPRKPKPAPKGGKKRKTLFGD